MRRKNLLTINTVSLEKVGIPYFRLHNSQQYQKSSIHLPKIIPQISWRFQILIVKLERIYEKYFEFRKSQGKIIHTFKYNYLISYVFIRLFKYLLTTYYFQSDGKTQILQNETKGHVHTSQKEKRKEFTYEKIV